MVKGISEEIIIEEQICPQCNGKGCITDHMLGIFTAGLGYLFQIIGDEYKNQCPTCKGTGKIEIKKVISH